MLLSIQVLYAQKHIYEHFGVDDGLPSSEVFDVYQDDLGYIWFATDKGLSRYNGYEFENFTTKDGLPGNTILDFYPQKDGRVFCLDYHSNTLFYFDAVFDGFKIYQFHGELKKHLPSNAVLKSLTMDESETLIVGGYGFRGFVEISSDGEASMHYPKDSILNRNPDQKVRQLNLGVLSEKEVFSSLYFDYESNKNMVMIPVKNRITSRVDVEFLNQDQYAFIDHKLGVFSTKGSVIYYENEQNPIGIKRIDDRSFWVGYYSNGAEIRAVSGEVIETFLPNRSVSSFLRDAEGSYWFTTIDDGIFQIKNPAIKIFSEEQITSLVKDHESNLYAGHYNGDISRISNLRTEILYKGLNDSPAYVEFNPDQSKVYGSSDFHLKSFTTKQTPISILGARKLSEDILSPLISVASNGYKSIMNDSIVNNEVGIRTEDVCMYNNTVLIATPDGLYVKKNDRIQSHHVSELVKTRLYDIDINNNTNNVYMASQEHGVIVYGDSIYNVSTKHGLTNSIVSEVYIENDSTVWACTNTGLNRINFKSDRTFSVNTITKSDGLLSNDINDVEVINDTVWVATKRGLCFFKKDIMNQEENASVLSLSLKSVAVNDVEVNEENIVLDYAQNSIDFTVEAISNRYTDKINYYYRLKGVDSTWVKTANRIISFPSLSPGNYTFEAKACVCGNSSNLITSYKFRVLPPFWRSWWFRVMCFVLFVALVYVFFRVRVLTYNRDVFRELIRLLIKRLKGDEQFYKFRANGEDFKIPTRDILYVNSQGNYLDVVAKKRTYTIRCKIGDFIGSTPDALEYLRVHRSYIIRIDQVSSKGKNWVVIQGNRIPIGETYLAVLDKIQF